MCRAAAAALLIAAAQAQTPTTTTQVTALSTAKAGYTTYRAAVLFDNSVRDVYALFGEAGDPLVIPPAFQVAAPFGTDVGPVRAAKQPRRAALSPRPLSSPLLLASPRLGRSKT